MKSAVAAPIAMAVAAVDQVTKAVWDSSTNGEFALGVWGARTSVMIAMMVIGLIVVVLWARPPWAVGLIVGGAVSNIWDRVLVGGVRDFIPIGWVLFNIADVAVAVGIVAWVSTPRREVHV